MDIYCDGLGYWYVLDVWLCECILCLFDGFLDEVVLVGMGVMGVVEGYDL